ncbi:hypothetical protein [Glycomyces buryatensis]|uniref:ParB/Sulfiredoxin domain-containing protein n=1 Tax=Glycomyces buryatensis TaxID=2570927 RepID=A0A4S8QHQ4_9ACTN|nr:hypothetical protein [Glycomyces buryatensis]THV40929.1 hypothetical protein FAB82_13855 [Glycomyces buryatensis]
MRFGDPPTFRTVDVPDGLGAIGIEGGPYNFRLKLAGDVIAEDGEVPSGSLVWMAKRLAYARDPEPLHQVEAWVEPPEWDTLRQWLRHVEPGDDPTVPLRPLLDLLAPDRYAIGLATLPKPFIVGTERDKPRTWYAGMDDRSDRSAIVPVNRWAPRAGVVAEYRRLISLEGRNPASVVLTHSDSEVYYLLDGHHKLAAYMKASREPLCVVIEVDTPGPAQYFDHLNEPKDDYRVVEHRRGNGLVSVFGRDGASALLIGGKPYLVEGWASTRTCDRLAVRSGDPRFRKKLRRLSDWLRAPDPRSAADPLSAVWRLLAPGRYGFRRWVPERYYVELGAESRYASWHYGITTPDFGASLVVTDQWPPPDGKTVNEYARMIRAGARPLVLTLRASRADDEEDAVAFVIDGHHKLKAYQATGIAPHTAWTSPSCRTRWPAPRTICAKSSATPPTSPPPPLPS